MNIIREYKTRAWWAMARYIRQRDKKCVTCGAPGTQAGHFIPNTDKPNSSLGGNELWYDERNVHNQCFNCNINKSGNIPAYRKFMIDRYGESIIQELSTLDNTPRKWTIKEVEEVEKYYLDRFNQLVNKNTE